MQRSDSQSKGLKIRVDIITYALLNMVSINTFLSKGNVENKLMAALSTVTAGEKDHTI